MSVFRSISKVAPFAIVSTVACANYSQLQTAATTPKGVTEKVVGLTFNKYEVKVDDKKQGVTVPALLVGIRHGVTEKLEVQASAWIPLGAKVGAKYQLVGKAGQRGLQVAAGGHAGYLTITAESNGSKAEQKLLDVYVPLHVGYQVSQQLSVYAAPQYVLRTSFGDAGSAVGHAFGATAGVKVSKLMFEGGVNYDTLWGSTIINTAVDVAF